MAQQRETRRETVNEFVGRRYFNYSGNQISLQKDSKGMIAIASTAAVRTWIVNSSFLGLDSLNNRVVNMLLRLLETYKESN